MKKRIIRKMLIVIAAIILVICIGVAVFWYFSPRNIQGSVTAYFHLYSPPTDEILISIIDDFKNEYPEVSINTKIMPYQDMRRDLFSYIKNSNDGLQNSSQNRDEVILTVLTGADMVNPQISPYLIDSSPWIQLQWKLYYNISQLKKAGFDEDELKRISSKGFDDFVETFSPIAKSNGESLFLLGADFYLPWLAWVQHLQALENRGRMPSDYSLTSWQDGLETWSRLSENGLFNEDYKSSNTASALLGISSGKGLFVLSDSLVYQVYPPEERSNIAGIDFPGSKSWQIGTSFYLALLDLSRQAETEEKNTSIPAGQVFRKYLHSEPVREKLLTTTGIFLLPFSRDKGFLAKREIPSITQNTRDPEIQELLKYLDEE